MKLQRDKGGREMKKYFGVITTYDDHGKVTANLIDVKEGDQKPENEFKSMHRLCDAALMQP